MKDFKRMGYEPYLISARTGEGVETLIEALSKALQSIPIEQPIPEISPSLETVSQ